MMVTVISLRLFWFPLTGQVNWKLPVGVIVSVNVLWMRVSPVLDWQRSKGVPGLLPNACWDRLQAPRDPEDNKVWKQTHDTHS